MIFPKSCAPGRCLCRSASGATVGHFDISANAKLVKPRKCHGTLISEEDFEYSMKSHWKFGRGFIRVPALASTAVVLAACQSFAQNAPSVPSFEVAAIHRVPNAEEGRTPPVETLPGGRVTTNATLRGLVMYAYDVKDLQISEGPQWTRSEYFRFVASAGDNGNPSLAEIRRMLQTLLEDRFQLKLRREDKEMSIYLLTVGKNGPKLKESPPEARFSMTAGLGKLTATKLPMARLATALSVSVGQPVLDKTGLTGEYDVTLEGSQVGLIPKPGASSPADDTGAPSVFTAIQEQLGLRLDSAKAPVEFLNIERVERPSEN
jgi:bla regulator protein blaR1